MTLHEWLYGPPLGWCETPTPPRDGERVEYRGTVRDYIRDRLGECLGARVLDVQQHIKPTETFLSIPVAEITGAF